LKTYIFSSLFFASLFLTELFSQNLVFTVTGALPVDEMGVTLQHEHLLVDFIGADSTGYHRWERDEVVEVMLPHLLALKKEGCETFIDPTPAYLGRDPLLLKELSLKSGLNIITNTGYYGAVEDQYIPAHAWDETFQQLACRWISEFENGIEGTGIKPGFIKIAVDRKVPLSEIDTKLVKAAAEAHRKTGLTIVSHTGYGERAFEQLAILEKNKVAPDAFVWVHAQHGTKEDHIKAARLGAWVSLDNAKDREGRLEEFVTRLTYMKENDLLHRVLISHDAGWYRPGEENGGKIRGYTYIFTTLIPALKQNGFTEAEINQLMETNPAKAFAIHKREL